jgi:hypothetical protein
MAKEQVTETMAILKFFGKRPGQTTSDFAGELKQLTAAERHELAEGAAKEMGMELVGISK